MGGESRAWSIGSDGDQAGRSGGDTVRGHCLVCSAQTPGTPTRPLQEPVSPPGGGELGAGTCGACLFNFPQRWEARSQVTPLLELTDKG